MSPIYGNYFQDIVERKMLGKATRGRKKMQFLHELMEREIMDSWKI